MASFSVGQQLGGRYRLDAVLARGGMGAVYRATDMRLGRGVAIKVLLSELSADTTEVTRFEREASAVASLHHPGIVQVLDVGRDGDTPYLVMEHVQGRTLADILGKEGRLDPARACDLVEQALFAISVAHGAGIIHRDLKPANLMVVPTGGREMIKVLDFGIAQLKRGSAYTRLTQTGALVGTPMFMAPEQVRGEVCDARTDVYAMGVVLWCTLTGRKPFASKDLGEVVVKVLDEIPARADRVEPSVPAAMATAAEIAMQKRPDARFATASAFASALVDLRVRASMPPAAPTAGRASMPSPPQAPTLGSPAPVFVAPAPSPGPASAPTVVGAPLLPPSAFSPLSLPPSPSALPQAIAGISTRAIALTSLALVVALCVSVCLVGGWLLRCTASEPPPAAPPMVPSTWPAVGQSPNLGGGGSICEQAARCCEILVGRGGSCSTLRGLERYPTGAGACAESLAQYRESAARMGRSCD